MKYQDSAIYKEIMTPRERKFFDDFVYAQQEDKDEAIKELQQLCKMNKFKNRKKMIDLFEHTNPNGDITSRSGRSTSNEEEIREPKKKGTSKEVFKKNAFRRWKRKGFVTFKNGKQFVTLKGVEYEIHLEGKAVHLVVPGQQELLKTEHKGNGKKRK